ncbi:MAG: hypothetical protein ACJA0H_000477 [Francisellaceae bacterium]|jgi:hypothetical protein
MINVFIGVVLYSEPAGKTLTFTSISRVDFKRLNIKPFFYIKDNSIAGHSNSFFEEGFGHEYCVAHNTKNEKLSVVYNEMISFSVINDVPSDIYIILDDDSKIMHDYFCGLIDFYKSEASVAVPIIRNNGEIISPGKVDGIKGKSITESEFRTGVNKNKNFVAMMSGTAIKESIFEVDGITFCEKLSFYGVDTKFFLDYQEKNNKIFIIDYSLEHHSALRDTNYDFNNMYQRLANVMQAHFYIFSNKPGYKIKLFAYFPRFILGKVLKFKDLRFFMLFKNYICFWRLDDK